MSDDSRADRKAIADRLRELALLVETGCAETTAVSLRIADGRRYHKLEIVEPGHRAIHVEVSAQDPDRWMRELDHRIEPKPGS